MPFFPGTSLPGFVFMLAEGNDRKVVRPITCKHYTYNIEILARTRPGKMARMVILNKKKDFIG